ncbi:UvrD-helicase domain-containing protein [Rhodococcoides yunnanense]|uniref:UvrD-helicase domain-containing protein n=1 Tax=Rhodococcoides yunnanense TaxID=278209 RepID=UPI000AE32CEB|nr:UvrD-helicase domain-containing protein [Rhodococcus yunnanensis]
MATVENSLVDHVDRHRIEIDTSATLFVEAGAGSGKTHSLVRRICHLVLDGGIELDRIAAITFTEKAAAELRERVRTHLSSFEGDVADRAMRQIDTAAIGTLHSFAARIVSEHPLEAGVPPRVAVVDAMGSQLSFERRWRRMRAALFADESASPSGLADAMRIILGAGASLDQVRTLADALDRSWDRLTVADTAPTMVVADIETLLRAADEVVDLATDCSDPSDGLAVWLSAVAQWRLDMAGAKSTTAWIALASDDGFPKPGNSRGRGANWVGGTARVNEIRAAVKELKESVLAERTRYVASALAIVVHHLSRVIVDEAAERKRRGELEFHDLLVHARNVLRNKDVRQRVHDSYQRIMLDEFQDTDPLQLEIARLIVDGPDTVGRLFTVGDPKQSIYRFRRADIASYMAARDTTDADDVVRLTTNFRSTKPVLDWVNSVFGMLVAADGYIQPEYTPLDPAPGRPEWSVERGLGPAPFVFEDSGDEVEDEHLLSPAQVLRAHESRDVARVIATALDQGWQKEVGRSGEYAHQPIALSDICILIPSRAVLPFLERSLDKAGIEFRSEASSLVYSTQEVHDLLATCRALADTANEAAVVASLRTPLFGCGDDDLLRWKAAGGRWEWWSDKPVGLDDSPVAAGLAYLKSVWSELALFSPGALLSRLAADRRVFEVSMDSPRHRDVWRRLRFVIDQAHAWFGEDGGDLRDYLDWAQTQQDENARVTEAVLPEVGVNAVRIMTMHAAKGLQFPMVIVAGMSGNFRPMSEPVVWDDDGAMHLNVSAGVQSVDYKAVAGIERAHTEAERVRLLYVACTRAESFLAVSGYVGASQSWGKTLAVGLVGVPNVVPDLIDPVRVEDGAHSGASTLESWDEWQAETYHVAATSSLPSTVSATQIAHGTLPVHEQVLEEYRSAGLLFAKVSDEVVGPAVGSTESGTGLGIALHAVVEMVPLDTALDSAFDEKARAAGGLAGLVDLDRFVLLARSVFSSEPVVRASAREHWQEMQLAGVSPSGDVVVEGIADLVYREDDGSLVIVDYKTDVAVTSETLEAYWAQLSVYADLLTRATGEQVSGVVLVFARPGEARVVGRSSS